MAILRFLSGMCFVMAWSTLLAQNADDILTRHIDAMGGMDNWNKVTNIKITGAPDGGGVKFIETQIVIDHKVMRMDIIFNGEDNYAIATPAGGWNYTTVSPKGSPMKITPIPADQLKAVLPKLDIKRDLILDKAAILKSEYIRTDTINNKACYVIKISYNDGNTETAFFDIATAFLIREEKISSQNGNEQEEVLGYSNFQKQPGGIVYPMTYKRQNQLPTKKIPTAK